MCAKKRSFLESQVLLLTRQTVNSFYSRKPEDTVANMASDFMWIGAYDYQWCEGLDEFLATTRSEYAAPAPALSDEEYRVLCHDRTYWTVYGRYVATNPLDDGSALICHVRCTLVWERRENRFILRHIHGSNAQDVPVLAEAPHAEPGTWNNNFIEYVKAMSLHASSTQRLPFRACADKSGCRYLYPTDIVYMKAANQHTFVYTKDGTIEVDGLLSSHLAGLPETFLRIHKSYVVNTLYAVGLCRYRVTLLDGSKIPVSKALYMDVKQFLNRGKTGKAKPRAKAKADAVQPREIPSAAQE